MRQLSKMEVVASINMTSVPNLDCYNEGDAARQQMYSTTPTSPTYLHLAPRLIGQRLSSLDSSWADSPSTCHLQATKKGIQKRMGLTDWLRGMSPAGSPVPSTPAPDRPCYDQATKELLVTPPFAGTKPKFTGSGPLLPLRSVKPRSRDIIY